MADLDLPPELEAFTVKASSLVRDALQAAPSLKYKRQIAVAILGVAIATCDGFGIDVLDACKVLREDLAEERASQN